MRLDQRAGRKVFFSTYLEPYQMVELKELSQRTKVPVAVFAREGIEMVLARYKEQQGEIFAVVEA